MTTSTSRGSAEIYEFPPRGRFALNGRNASQPRAKVDPQPLVKVVSGSGWYHEAAIEEAEVSRGKYLRNALGGDAASHAENRPAHPFA